MSVPERNTVGVPRVWKGERRSFDQCQTSDMITNIAILTLVFLGAGSSQLLHISSPPHLQLGGRARLECFTTPDADNMTLYSTTWFKDGQEFYRFMPSVLPHAEVFSVPGISIDVNCVSYNLFIYFSTTTLFLMNTRNSLFLSRPRALRARSA